MKTAGRILGSAFFIEGFEVQDAPRYGAERRGAPINSYVRAAREPINERGIVLRPDLVVVADDTLVPIPAAGVLVGVGPDTVILIDSTVGADEWRKRLNTQATVIVLPAPEGRDREELPFVGAECAAAAARLLGVISQDALNEAIRDELGGYGEAIVGQNVEAADRAYGLMAAHEGKVAEGRAADAAAFAAPEWVELPLDEVRLSGPAVHAGATSVEVRTGLWRTMRPVIDYDHCNKCTWVCGSFCPDSAISVGADGHPVIDYDHCKGCMICVAVCPPHAIGAIPETQAQEQEKEKQGAPA
jgi:pyruvate ferredoxin oxidoreductase gamma subunit